MKKKVLSIVLVGCLAGTLFAGCGSSNSSDASTDTAETTDTTATADTADAAEDVSASTEAGEEVETAVADSDVDYEELELTCCVSYNENTNWGQTMATFVDYVEEASGGAVTVNTYYGATLCDVSEEADYVVNGAVDICFSLPVWAKEIIPIWNLTGNSPGGNEGCVELANYIYFENEETAKMAEDEATNAGLKVLGVMSGPVNAICATTPITDWDSVAETMMGCASFAQTFENLGCNVQTFQMGDIYESLSRGLITSSSGGLNNIDVNGWGEVCKYILCLTCANATPTVIMNLDKWNSLPEATQQLIQDGVDYAQEQSITIQEEGDAESIDNLLAQDCTIEYMSEEDNDIYIGEMYKGNYASYYEFAEALGEADAYDAVAEATLDYLDIGLTLQDLKDSME